MTRVTINHIGFIDDYIFTNKIPAFKFFINTFFSKGRGFGNVRIFFN